MTIATGFFAPSSSSVLWTPASLAAPPSIWANETSGIAMSGSNIISQWDDLTANAYNLTPANYPEQAPTAIASGLNGLRTVRYDGADNVMRANIAGAKALYKNVTQGWVALVYKRVSGSAAIRYVFGTSTPTNGSARFYLQCDHTTAAGRIVLRVRRLDGDAAATLLASTLLNDTNWHIVIATMDWGNRTGTIYIDGAQDAQNTTLTTAGSTSNTAGFDLCYGAVTAGGPSNTEHAECMNGVAIPTSTEREKIEGYLAYRWGLQGNLPVGHPYKTSPP